MASVFTSFLVLGNFWAALNFLPNHHFLLLKNTSSNVLTAAASASASRASAAGLTCACRFLNSASNTSPDAQHIGSNTAHCIVLPHFVLSVPNTRFHYIAAYSCIKKLISEKSELNKHFRRISKIVSKKYGTVIILLFS